MSECRICNKKLSIYFFKNKPVCFRCDALEIDLEIALDDERKAVFKLKPGEKEKLKKKSPTPFKKAS